MFDLAAVVETQGAEYAIAALRQCGADRCQAALDTIEKVNPAAVEAINAQLMVREANRHLVGTAHGISRDLLQRVLAEAHA